MPKLYRAGNWSIDEVTWEVELAAHLAAGGVRFRTCNLAAGKVVVHSARPRDPAVQLAEFIEATNRSAVR